MKLIKGGEEITLEPVEVAMVREALKAGKMTVRIRGAVCWVYNNKNLKEDCHG